MIFWITQKIESNNFQLEEKAFSLNEVIDSIKYDLDAIVSNKGVDFVVRLEDDFIDGWLGDQVRVKQILLNLASNAVKFTEKGSVKLEVSYKKVKGQMAIVANVIDSGIGMSEEAQSRIFERFAQADTSTTRKYGGTGLGMSITISLVKMMGGDIQLTSNVGQGTSVKVILPLKPAELDLLQEKKSIASAPLMLDKKILIAEDNKMNQALIVAMLKTTQAEITLVENGFLAVDAIKNAEFDLVLMDIHMPGMDGSEAQLKIKSINPNIPVIALTANVMADEVKSYLQQGFVEHIAKPINMGNLYGLLSKYV